MPALPTGTATFVLTDMERQTALLERHREDMVRAILRHNAIIRMIVEANGGWFVKERGEGDSTFSVFTSAESAVRAAAEVQIAMRDEPWPEHLPIKVRIGVHTGEAELIDGDYLSPTINRCARIRAVALGGQTLVSGTTVQLLDTDRRFHDFGLCRLKDLLRPERLYGLISTGLAEEASRPRTLDAVPHNLPIQLNAFIGGEAEVDRIRVKLAPGRCVTLTGSGGVGKTRLALQTASESFARFPGGLFFVDLSTREPGEDLRAATAVAMGLPSVDGLRSSLAESPVLLVVDNAEHLVDDAAALVADLLDWGSQAHVLVTSREPLRLPAEVAIRVPSLEIPDPASTFAEALRTDSARLFVERASLADSAFQIGAPDLPHLVSILQTLDGLPLAIEHAAAQVSVLSLRQIDQRLRASFDWMGAEQRNVAPRHQTVRATIDWSYRLLSEQEQTLLRRLSVFSGPWTAEAAEWVCGQDLDFLDVLRNLVRKSLVQPVEGSAETRLHTLLMPTRQFLQELADPQEQADLRERHADWYRGLARRAAAEFESQQERWLAELNLQRANLVRALEAHLGANPEALPDFVLDLRHWWMRSGQLSDSLHWHRLASEFLVGSKNDTALTLWNSLVAVLWKLGRSEEAERAIDHALPLAEHAGPKLQAATYNSAAMLRYQRGDAEGAAEFFLRNLAIFEAAGDPSATATSLSNLAECLRLTGRPDESEPLLRRAIRLAEEAGNQAKVARIQGNLASALTALGRIPEAKEAFVAAFGIWSGLQDIPFIGEGLNDLAVLAEASGDREAALEFLAASASLLRQCGSSLDFYQDRQRGQLLDRIGPAKQARKANVSSAVASAMDWLRT